MSDWHASPFTGLFTRFGPTPTRPHDPALAVAGGLTASWSPNHDGTTASGIGLDQSSASAATVGEAIERLQASVLPNDGLIMARYADWPLPEPAVAPSRWVLFHAEQYGSAGFPFEPLMDESECAWVRCRQADTGVPNWVPAELAYLHVPGGHRFAPGYSTGLACGRTGHPLLLRSLQEVIERDAVVGAWWGRYALLEHSFGHVIALLGSDWRDRVVRRNLRYRCFRVVSPFSAHVTVVTLEGEDREGFVFSIGSACRETRRASWEKSLLEAVHGRHYARHLKSQYRSIDVPRSFAEHAVYYSLYPDRLRDTVLASPATMKDDNDDAMELLSGLLARLDRPVLFRSMTPPALASENLGWHVVRVMVPGLQPLHGHHALPHLGGPLWAPRGLAAWRSMPPHPFP